MSSYTIQQLAEMKGTSEPVGAALIAMQAEIQRLSDALAEARAWRDAIDDALVTECIGTADSFPDATTAVARLIDWVMSVAVDPRVSEPASNLRDKALDEAAEAVCGYIHPAYGKLPGDPFATAVVRALKSPKPQED